MARKVWTGSRTLSRLHVPVGDLRPHPRNPRRGVVSEIRKSLERFGQQRPILALADGTIVAGHHVYYAAQELEWTHIAVVRSDLSDAEIDAYLVADNRTAEIGTNDQTVLAEILREQYEAGKLEGTGYAPEDYETLLADLEERARIEEEMFREPGTEEEQGKLDERDAPALREFVLTYTADQGEQFRVYLGVLRKEWQEREVSGLVYRAVEEAARSRR